MDLSRTQGLARRRWWGQTWMYPTSVGRKARRSWPSTPRILAHWLQDRMRYFAIRCAPTLLQMAEGRGPAPMRRCHLQSGMEFALALIRRWLLTAEAISFTAISWCFLGTATV